MGGASLNPAAQVAFQTHPFLAQWLILMSDEWMRRGFEAFCGLPVAALVWYLGERTALKRMPKVAKRFIPALAFGIGTPLAAALAAYVPGIDVKECALLVIGSGGGFAHATHETVNGAVRWKERSQIRPPKNPPGSPGDGDSIEGGK